MGKKDEGMFPFTSVWENIITELWIKNNNGYKKICLKKYI